MPRLHDLLAASAERWGDRTALVDPATSSSVTYAELDQLVDAVRDRLVDRGVQAGDRVGVLGKSIPSLTTIFGVLRAGAAYVPVDAHAPLSRGASILTDCSVRCVVAEPELAEGLSGEFGAARAGDAMGELKDVGPELAMVDGPSAGASTPGDDLTDLSYILYTSGSTGMPKGVMHTHASALSFVDWCSEVFDPSENDTFSSHAPFHFDLSILDIYVPLKHGAKLVLIGEEIGKHPTGLARLIAKERISVWYSTPSILRLLVEFGRLERLDWSALRTVLFAGEVFPMPNLRKLLEVWPHPRYFNLYGPTETNVCTYYALPRELPPEQVDPVPIGVVCSGDRGRVLDEGGADVEAGSEGELCIAGGSVMRAYWNQPEKSAQAFVELDGDRWYRTGDLVIERDGGNYDFRGRRDRMIKRRGYRIEPGEIESALYRHPEVHEAAVLALADDAGAVEIVAHLSTVDGAELAMIGLKKWCAENLPRYMIPDRFSFHARLPKTSTDKIDYQALKHAD